MRQRWRQCVHAAALRAARPCSSTEGSASMQQHWGWCVHAALLGEGMFPATLTFCTRCHQEQKKIQSKEAETSGTVAVPAATRNNRKYSQKEPKQAELWLYPVPSGTTENTVKRSRNKRNCGCTRCHQEQQKVKQKKPKQAELC